MENDSYWNELKEIDESIELIALIIRSLNPTKGC